MIHLAKQIYYITISPLLRRIWTPSRKCFILYLRELSSRSFCVPSFASNSYHFLLTLLQDQTCHFLLRSIYYSVHLRKNHLEDSLPCITHIYCFVSFLYTLGPHWNCLWLTSFPSLWVCLSCCSVSKAQSSSFGWFKWKSENKG